jgi:hypothetical protein
MRRLSKGGTDGRIADPIEQNTVFPLHMDRTKIKRDVI